MKPSTGVFLAVALAAATAAQATDLLQVYQRSLDTDPLLQQATATRLATRETKTQALINLLPLDVSANKAWAGVGNETITSRSTLNLSLSVSLFSWDSWVALKAADATVAQAEANFRSAEQSLVQRVTSQYFAVLAAQDTLTAQQSALDSVQIQLDQAERRFDVGLIAVTDVEIARASRDSTAAAVIAAKRTLATQQDLLRAITGETYASLAAPGDDMPLLTPDPASEDSWVATAMNQNASLIASRLSADIAHDSLLTAYGGHLPTVSVGVTRNWALDHGAAASSNSLAAATAAASLPLPLGFATDTHDLIWGVAVSVPLFTSGATESKVRQARYTWDAAKAGLDYSSRQTEEQTRDAYQGIEQQPGPLGQQIGRVRLVDQPRLDGGQVGFQIASRDCRHEAPAGRGAHRPRRPGKTNRTPGGDRCSVADFGLGAKANSRREGDGGNASIRSSRWSQGVQPGRALLIADFRAFTAADRGHRS